MGPRVLGRILLFLVLTTASGSRLHAWDWLTFGPLEAEAILRFDGAERSSNTAEDSSDSLWRAGFRVSQEAYTEDPRIARYLVTVEPIWATGKVKIGEDTDDRKGEYLNYVIQAEGLQGTPGPVGFNLSMLQSQDLNTGSLGSRYENETREHGAGVNWKNDAFPMWLKFNSRTLKQSYRSRLDGPVSERNDKLDVWSIVGRSSKTDLLIEHQSMDDRVPERDHDYDLNTARFNHRLFWGHRSSLRSNWWYYDRTGFNSYRRINGEESAEVHHTDKLFSRTAYRYLRLEQDQTTNQHSGEFRLNYTQSSIWRSQGNIGATSRTSDRVDEVRWRAGFGTDLKKGGLPLGANLFGGFGYSYELTDRDSSLGLIEIVEEPHVIPQAGDAILRQRFVLTATIVVTDGAGQLVYDRGVDYEVFDIGSDLTQIQAIPGGRIETGSTILVSYKAQALPSQEFSTQNIRYNLGLSLPWMRFTHYDSTSKNDLISGDGESLLNDRRDSGTLLEFFWRMAEVDARVSAERRHNEYGDYESTSYIARQGLAWAVSAKASVHLNLWQEFTESSSRDTDLYYAELTMDWQPLYNLSLRPVLGYWKRRDVLPGEPEVVRDDEFIKAGFRLRWFYRKVVFNLDFYANQRSVDETQTRENLLRFDLTRRF